MKRGPRDPMPQSGHKPGPTNRRKLKSHVSNVIDLADDGRELADSTVACVLELVRHLRHIKRHAKRADERVNAERANDR
jgi:hypothetical protein